MRYILSVLMLLVATGCTIEANNFNIDQVVEEEKQNPAVTKFRGTFAGSNLSGAIDFYVAAAVTLPAAAPIQPAATFTATVTAVASVTDGTNLSFNGQYEDEGNTINVSGNGYAVETTLTADGLTGTLRAPNGVTAYVTAVVEDSSNDEQVLVFCGTWEGTGGEGPIGGVWNVVYVEGSSEFNGVSTQPDGRSEPFFGSISGDSISISGYWGSATGTRNGESISGTWTSSGGDGGTGTWEGSTAACK